MFVLVTKKLELFLYILTLSGCKQHDIQYSYMLQHPFSLQVSQEYRFVVSESVLQQPLDKMSVREQT